LDGGVAMLYVGYNFAVDDKGIEFQNMKVPAGYDVSDLFEVEVTEEGNLYLKAVEKEQ